MGKLRTAKWNRKECGCIKTELQNAGRVVIRCEDHRGQLTKSGRLVCYLDDSGIVRAEHGDDPILNPGLGNVEQVYFARLGDLIKIGLSRDPRERARGLNATLLGSLKGGRDLEVQMHRKFAHLREKKGEWFRAEPDLLEFIKELP